MPASNASAIARLNHKMTGCDRHTAAHPVWQRDYGLTLVSRRIPSQLRKAARRPMCYGALARRQYPLRAPDVLSRSMARPMGSLPIFRLSTATSMATIEQACDRIEKACADLG
jgi:hypothetical protein